MLMDSHLVLLRKRQKNLYASKIVLLSPAKLNLYLNITGKYPAQSKYSGFHRIESIFERISLCDKISLELTRSPYIKILSNKKYLETADNLCVKAAALLKEKLCLPYGFKIFLKKNIPVGSGLGGGSSNAATVILGINNLLKLNLTNSDLYKFGESVGSDVNFFLSQSSFAVVSGRGEQVSPFQGKCFDHLILWPNVHLSTKEVYNYKTVKLTNFLPNVKMLQQALKKGDVEAAKKNIFNALENSALSLCEKLSIAYKKLTTMGITVKVTGSGSAMYTFLDDISEKKIKNILSRGWLIFKVKTF